MAINIVGKPTKSHPGYNPVEYYIDSTNKNQQGFRYLIQIFSAGTSTQLTADLKIAPRFGDGVGYADVSKHLQNYLDGYVNLTATTFSSADADSVVNYDIKFGESYTTSWSIVDYTFISGSTGFSGTSAHPYVVGDQILVQLTSTYNDFRDALNGYFTVTAVPSTTTLQVNLDWIGSEGATPGTIKYADDRKSRYENLSSVTATTAINYAMDISSFQDLCNTYPAVPAWVLTGATSEFLTNIPRTGFRVTDSQFLFVQAFDNKTNNAQFAFFQNSNGDIFNKSISSSSMTVKQIPCGPANAGTLTTISGTTGLIKDDTEWYDVWTANGTSGQTSEKLRIYMDNRCVINDIQILFMDRAGSLASFAFQNRMFENVTTSKDKFNQEMGTNASGKGFFFNTFDKGMTTFTSTIEKSYELNANYMTDEMSVYFEELLSSPYTYVKWTDGKWYACDVADGTQSIDRTKNQKLIKKKVNIKFSISNPVNI